MHETLDSDIFSSSKCLCDVRNLKVAQSRSAKASQANEVPTEQRWHLPWNEIDFISDRLNLLSFTEQQNSSSAEM